GILVEEADAGVVGGPAPALDAPVAGLVDVGAGWDQVLQRHPGGEQALMPVAQGQLRDFDGAWHRAKLLLCEPGQFRRTARRYSSDTRASSASYWPRANNRGRNSLVGDDSALGNWRHASQPTCDDQTWTLTAIARQPASPQEQTNTSLKSGNHGGVAGTP